MNLIKKLILRALRMEVESVVRQPQADREHAVRTVKPKDGSTFLAQHPSLWDDVLAMADSCIKAVRKLWTKPNQMESYDQMKARIKRQDEWVRQTLLASDRPEVRALAQRHGDVQEHVSLDPHLKEIMQGVADSRLRQFAAEAAAAARAKKPFLRWIAEEQRWGLDYVRSESTTHCSPKLFYCIAKFNLLNQKGKR